MGFQLNFDGVNDNYELLPEGEYEMIITEADIGTDQKQRPRINLKLVVRNDVASGLTAQHKNAVVFHSIYKSKEPKPEDASTDGFSFASLMRIGKAARLHNGKNYGSLNGYVSDLYLRPVLITIYHDEYNGKKNARVKYWNESKFPEVYHRLKDIPNAVTSVPQTRQSSPAPMPQNVQPEFTEITGDDDLPF